MTLEQLYTDFKVGKTIVDFYAEWCGPCKVAMPILEKFVADNPDVKLIKINVDEHPDIASEFVVRSIPTIMLFEDGYLHTRHSGVMQPAQIIEAFETKK